MGRKPGELSDIVREYILALRIHTRQNTQPEPKPADRIQFGARITKKRKKDRGGVQISEELRQMFRDHSRHVGDAELHARRKKAQAAMQRARELASEDVKYCCGMIRRASYESDCACNENQFYQQVNSL